MFIHLAVNIESYLSIVFWIVLCVLLMRILKNNGNIHQSWYVLLGIVIIITSKMSEIYLLYTLTKVNVQFYSIEYLYLGKFNFLLFIIGISFVVLSLIHINNPSVGKNNREIKWNWWAFIFCPFWSIYHKVWWGLLSWIPVIGLLFSVYMGMYGTNLITKNKREKLKTQL